jgi:hypothetical protein
MRVWSSVLEYLKSGKVRSQRMREGWNTKKYEHVFIQRRKCMKP